jgi:hypothetical protein
MRRYYPGITLFKLLASFLVVVGHVKIPLMFAQSGSTPFLFEIVPCFYMIAGLLAYKGWSSAENSFQYVTRYLKWILLIYSWLCIMYLVNTVMPGLSGAELTMNNIVGLAKRLFDKLLIRGASPEAWFIPPLIFGIIASYYFDSRNKLRFAAGLAVTGFVFAQLMCGTLRILTEISFGNIILYRLKHTVLVELIAYGYLAYGFPFVLAGVLIGKYEAEFFRSKIGWFVRMAILLTVLELIFLKIFAAGHYPYRVVMSILPLSLLLFYGVLHIRIDRIKAQHAFINLFSIVLYFTHWVLIRNNIKFLNWQKEDMTVWQTVFCICLTYFEGFALTVFIRLLLQYRKVWGIKKHRKAELQPVQE